MRLGRRSIDTPNFYIRSLHSVFFRHAQLHTAEMISWYYRRLAATETPTTPTCATPYDEERLDCDEPAGSGWRRPSKYLQFPRPTKVTAYLLLIDFVIVALLVFTLQPLITLLRRNEELFQPRVALSRHDIKAASWPHPEERKIPRILHQTCANSTIPSKWVDSQRSCISAYSEFEYKVC